MLNVYEDLPSNKTLWFFKMNFGIQISNQLESSDHLLDV